MIVKEFTRLDTAFRICLDSGTLPREDHLKIGQSLESYFAINPLFRLSCTLFKSIEHLYLQVNLQGFILPLTYKEPASIHSI